MNPDYSRSRRRVSFSAQAEPQHQQDRQGPLLDLSALNRASASTEPYQHVLVPNLLMPGASERLSEGYLDIKVTGYVTLEPETLSPAFAALMEEIKGPELTEGLSSKFGRNMHAFPRLVTVRRWSQAKEGHIHTDSERKVMTMLIYLNPDWGDTSGGRLRVLYDDKNFAPYALKIPPINGTAFAFTRSDISWHGHLPFTGERRVVQVTWLRDAEALNRKTSNNHFHQRLKRLFGRAKSPEQASAV
jgi:SM-20-related protein